MTKSTIHERLATSNARFPFKEKQSKSKGLCFRQEVSLDGNGMALDVVYKGYDHLTLDFRALKKKDGRKSDKRAYMWQLDSLGAVQLASLLFYLVDDHLRDSDESPFFYIVSPEKASFGPNWIKEDINTALERTRNRKSRSLLFGLMKRFVEVCDDDEFLYLVHKILDEWASSSGDDFSIQQSEKASLQLGLGQVPDFDDFSMDGPTKQPPAQVNGLWQRVYIEPDPISKERYNIGVILHGPSGVQGRFLSEQSHLKCVMDDKSIDNTLFAIKHIEQSIKDNGYVPKMDKVGLSAKLPASGQSEAKILNELFDQAVPLNRPTLSGKQ